MTQVPLTFSFLHQWGEISRFAISYALPGRGSQVKNSDVENVKFNKKS